MEAEAGKYGVWLSQSEMAMIEKALEWLENSSHVFKKTSKIGAIKNLRNDLEKIRKNGNGRRKQLSGERKRQRKLGDGKGKGN